MIDYSQFGESKILWDIFEKIGTRSKFAVEFGAADGYRGSNIRMFLENGWKGLQVEGVSDVKNNVKREFITKDNINDLFQKYEVPNDLDLVTIDIDGNDFWVWKALTYDPAVVVIEYNSNFQKDVSVSLEYDENHRFDGSYAYGASFKAYDNLAKEKGYYFYAEVSFANLIFVKDEFRENLGTHSSISNVEKLPVVNHAQALAHDKKFIRV